MSVNVGMFYVILSVWFTIEEHFVGFSKITQGEGSCINVQLRHIFLWSEPAGWTSFGEISKQGNNIFNNLLFPF